MLYISISSLENVKLVSGLLYKLSVVSTENLSTQYYCHWLVHPKNNEVVLSLPESTIYIHPDADETILDPLLTLHSTLKEIANIHNIINENKANRLSAVDFLPAFYVDNAKTSEDLQNEGWFTEL